MTKPTMNEAIKNLIKARDERNHQPIGLDRNMAVLVPIELINAAEDAWARKPDDASTSMQALKDSMNEIVECIESVTQTAKDTAANIKEDKNRRYEEYVEKLLQAMIPFIVFTVRLDESDLRIDDRDDLINPDIKLMLRAKEFRSMADVFNRVKDDLEKEEKEQCPTAKRLMSNDSPEWEEILSVLNEAEYFLSDTKRIHSNRQSYQECIDDLKTLLIKGEEHVRKQRADKSTRTEDQRLQEYQPKDPKQ